MVRVYGNTASRGRRTRIQVGVLCALAMVLAVSPVAQARERFVLDPGAAAVLRNGRLIFLECEPPRDGGAEVFFRRFLHPGAEWNIYAEKGRIAIRFEELSYETRRAALLGLFPRDYVDADGWHHFVAYEGADQETLWAICEWITGKGTTQEAVAKLNNASGSLKRGQEILIPRNLLNDVMAEPTPERAPKPHQLPEMIPDHQPVLTQLEGGGDLGKAGEELAYKRKSGEQYAVYRVKGGDTLYTKVVVRFTDFRENADIHAALDVIRESSELPDINTIEIGDRIFIPMEMLSARFKPMDHPDRIAYEESVRESERLREVARKPEKKPEGKRIVVVLDPGHGGEDIGTPVAKTWGLYEDEINYDIACRIKRLLDQEPNIDLYMTMRDPNHNYAVVEATKFVFDKDEQVLVTPPYDNINSTISANLRWCLANSIYRDEIAKGTDPKNIVFTSIHCDALFDGRLRGAMIYIPGAKYRKNEESAWPPDAYQKYAEVREDPRFESTTSERRRDEAMSRSFATVVLDELGNHRIKRHDMGDPIRNVIRRSGGKEFVVAVLRNNEIPTKILIEAANLSNETDRQRASDPWWREQFALAYVAALKSYYGLD